jgi:hypothetical protein
MNDIVLLSIITANMTYIVLLTIIAANANEHDLYCFIDYHNC